MTTATYREMGLQPTVTSQGSYRSNWAGLKGVTEIYRSTVGIVGMGESRAGRAGLIAQLANLAPYPESVPINHLVKVPGTPLADEPDLDPLEFVRTVAVARITMPRAKVRLSAGRRQMDESTQVLCFLAGANSIFYGDKLLVTGNPDVEADQDLLARTGMHTTRAHA